eukprot:TRINITY_DN165_c0_g2_i1.p1 TRINITY_DN165_c0_g2~~TRINITY_DN165_c0_g2_i1.p1  ORF type:complete len:249 (-),score=64.67 TRINITY_DN165_c0_g2_i1:146-892(-)
MPARTGVKKTIRKTKSLKAGLLFPVAKLGKRLRESWLAGGPHGRISGSASVYLAAVLEYLTAELVELAGNFSIQSLKKKRISPRAIASVSFQDEEFHILLKESVFPEAGTFSSLPPTLASASTPPTPSPSKGGKKKTSKAETVVKASPKKTKVAAVKKSTKESSSADSTSGYPKWQYEDRGWHDYAPDASKVVEETYQEWLKAKWTDVRAVRSGTWSYQVDFNNMKQTNIEHTNHTTRRIRRLEGPKS